MSCEPTGHPTEPRTSAPQPDPPVPQRTTTPPLVFLTFPEETRFLQLDAYHAADLPHLSVGAIQVATLPLLQLPASVGFLEWKPQRDLITLVYVEAPLRRQGIGTALVCVACRLHREATGRQLRASGTRTALGEAFVDHTDAPRTPLEQLIGPLTSACDARGATDRQLQVDNPEALLQEWRASGITFDHPVETYLRPTMD